jgi:hypothetical protein
MRMPPTGRVKNPTPKVAVVRSREEYSLSAGKKRREMITVRKPKTTKSYHSKALPMTAAAICFVRGAGVSIKIFLSSITESAALGCHGQLH